MGGCWDGFSKLPRAFAGCIRTDPLPFLVVSLTVLSVCPTREEVFARSMRAWVCIWLGLRHWNRLLWHQLLHFLRQRHSRLDFLWEKEYSGSREWLQSCRSCKLKKNQNTIRKQSLLGKWCSAHFYGGRRRKLPNKAKLSCIGRIKRAMQQRYWAKATEGHLTLFFLHYLFYPLPCPHSPPSWEQQKIALWDCLHFCEVGSQKE